MAYTWQPHHDGGDVTTWPPGTKSLGCRVHPRRLWHRRARCRNDVVFLWSHYHMGWSSCGYTCSSGGLIRGTRASYWGDQEAPPRQQWRARSPAAPNPRTLSLVVPPVVRKPCRADYAGELTSASSGSQVDTCYRLAPVNQRWPKQWKIRHIGCTYGTKRRSKYSAKTVITV
eukprot:7842214-Pyramimonas_sp.AAC.1